MAVGLIGDVMLLKLVAAPFAVIGVIGLTVARRNQS